MTERRVGEVVYNADKFTMIFFALPEPAESVESAYPGGWYTIREASRQRRAPFDQSPITSSTRRHMQLYQYVPAAARAN